MVCAPMPIEIWSFQVPLGPGGHDLLTFIGEKKKKSLMAGADSSYPLSLLLLPTIVVFPGSTEKIVLGPFC